MFTYTNNRDTEIKLVNDDTIEYININNLVLKKLIIVNLNNLRKIYFNNVEGLEIVIINCPKLSSIKNSFIDYPYYSKSFFLGKGCDNLTDLFLNCIHKLTIHDEELKNLQVFYVFCVNDINVNLEKYTSLNKVNINTSSISDIVINSNNLKEVSITDNVIDKIHIKGDNKNLIHLKITDQYNQLVIDKMLFNLSYLYIKGNDKIPYFPLPEKTEKLMIIKISICVSYHWRFINFIEDNIDKINLMDESGIPINVNVIKSYGDLKKCAKH